MRILLLGSSQTKHIRDLFSKDGHKIVESECKNGGFLGKIEFFSKLLVTDMVYHVGGIDISRSLFFRIARILGKKIVVHWIGTDVLNFTKLYEKEKKVINEQAINLAGSDLLKKELQEIGIKSFVVPIVSTEFCFEPLDAPQKHAVISYIPEAREDFYGMDLLKMVATAFPSVDFYIVANSGKNDKQPLNNIHYEGFLNPNEMQALYKKSSVLFRFPQHDGLSMMVLEALGLGKTVIYRYEFPFVLTPKTNSVEDVIKVFEKVLSVSPKTNKEGSDFVNTNFSIEKQMSRYREAGVLK